MGFSSAQPTAQGSGDLGGGCPKTRNFCEAVQDMRHIRQSMESGEAACLIE
jgi:hypothetical protein